MNIPSMIGLILVMVAIAVIGVVTARRQRYGYDREPPSREPPTSRGGEPYNNPLIPNFVKQHPTRTVIIVVVAIILVAIVGSSVVRVPAGHRGVLLTFGKVSPINLDEGIHIIMPWQNVVNMPVMIQKAEVTESTASNDLQEITTRLAVHYRIREDSAWIVYQTMRMDYLHLLVEPVIMEELKATTADWSAEKLITDRPLVVIQLQETLDMRLKVYGIDVMTVNFIDFQFSKEFWDAIERKVVVTQDALTEKNKVEIARFQQQQAIITAEGQYNVTVIRASAEAQQKIIAAEAEARRIMIEASATAEAIKQITSQMTPEYAQYLYLTQWNGILPSTLLGSVENIGLIIDTTP